MRDIKISHRYKLFSHQPGLAWPVPGTDFKAIIYPTKIILENQVESYTYSIPLTGIVNGFTVCLDLEKSLLSITGRYLEGYYKFVLKKEEEFLFVTCKNDPNLLSDKINILSSFLKPPSTKLFLGSTKKTNTYSLRERCSIHEIFPLMFQLSSSFILEQPTISSPTALKDLFKAIKDQNHDNFALQFEKVYRAFFYETFLPRGEDTEFQGLSSKKVKYPLELYHFLYTSFLSLFSKQNENELVLLPFLPKEFVIGRMINIPYKDFTLSLLWKGKRVQRVVIDAKKDLLLKILSKPHRSYRINNQVIAIGHPFRFKKGKNYLDRFTK